MGIVRRGILGLAVTLTITLGGVLGFATAASAAPSITVTPSSGIQPTGSTVVSVSGSGFAASSAGAILECNNDPNQPTVSLEGHATPVSCGPNPLAPGATNLAPTNSSGGFGPVSFTVTTGTVGPPATGTDSSGGNAATDAASYPCPPTPAQQAAGYSCVVAFGDATGNEGIQPISFAGACPAPGSPVGYDMAAADGGVFNFGSLPYCGSAAGLKLNKPIVGIATTHGGNGYWLVASDGGVFNFGNAAFYGSAGALTLNKPIVGMAVTHDGGGYWLVASDGGIFSYGDAVFYGSAGSLKLNKPIVGMAVTHDGGGYWLVASDGGIFSYGDAVYYGSTGGTALNSPIVGMAPTADGGGYWLVASDGGIFTYGDARFFGSAGGSTLVKPIIGMVATPDGQGYSLVSSGGGVLNYGDAIILGILVYPSLGTTVLNQPIVAASTA